MKIRGLFSSERLKGGWVPGAMFEDCQQWVSLMDTNRRGFTRCIYTGLASHIGEQQHLCVPPARPPSGSQAGEAGRAGEEGRLCHGAQGRGVKAQGRTHRRAHAVRGGTMFAHGSGSRAPGADLRVPRPIGANISLLSLTPRRALLQGKEGGLDASRQ
jgi:hypothetical protein